ncbi:transposable element Tcb2 transposase [Trichonephila clavipes]|nr:transposable element Tcb2 transposase [Trichonephila clavipes]
MRGTLTGQRYVHDILRPHVGLFLNGLPGAIFQQDNARPHTARVAQDFLRHFQTLKWPAHSPDLSPVEHVWDQLKRLMPSCHFVQDLELAVQDLWVHLPQDNIRPEETGGRQREKSLDNTGDWTTDISRFYRYQKMHGGGLFAIDALTVIPLTPAHRRLLCDAGNTGIFARQ